MNLQDWTDVQCLIGRYGKDSLFREIKNADTIDMNEQVCRRVVKLQSKFSQEKIREVSNGAATFYVWVCLLWDIERMRTHIFSYKYRLANQF